MSSTVIDNRSGYGRFFRAHDLMEDEEFIVEFSLDAPSDQDACFEPLVLNGEDVRLTQDNPTRVLALPGYYRVVPDTDVEEATVTVSAMFPVEIHWSV